MLLVAVGKWTKILCLCRNFRKEGQRCVVKKPLQFFNFSVTISRNERTYTLPFTINTIHKRFHWSSLTRDALWSAKKIDENFFFLAFRVVINKPNHRSLLLILGFAVPVAIWPRAVVSYRDFILRSVATLWVMSLVGITLTGPPKRRDDPRTNCGGPSRLKIIEETSNWPCIISG